VPRRQELRGASFADFPLLRCRSSRRSTPPF
jgi:hypothetical protein